jgi:hypothetical protein
MSWKNTWHTGIPWVNLKERDHLDKLGIDMRIILKYVYRKRMGIW